MKMNKYIQQSIDEKWLPAYRGELPVVDFLDTSNCACCNKFATINKLNRIDCNDCPIALAGYEDCWETPIRIAEGLGFAFLDGAYDLHAEATAACMMEVGFLREIGEAA